MVSKALRGALETDSGQVAAWRVALLYGAQFLAIGMMLPLLPVWLAARGLDAAAIGRVLAAQSLGRVVAQPLLAQVADRSGRMKLVMAACATLALAALVGLGLAEGWWPVFIGVVAVAFFFSPLVPLAEVLAVRTGARQGVAYGRMRLWGSLAFILGAMVAGVLMDVMAPTMLVWALVVAHALTLAAIVALPETPAEGQSGERDTWAGKGGWRGVLNGTFALFLLVAGLVQASHAMLYGFAALHWKGLGYSGTVVGLLVATGVLAEVALFWFSAQVTARLGAVRLLMLAATAGIVRWAGMAMDPPLAVLFVLQSLHAFTFGAAHLGAIAFVRTRVPARLAATGQALYSALSMGLFMTAAMWASGRLYAAYSARAWLAMAGMCVLARALAVVLRQVGRSPG